MNHLETLIKQYYEWQGYVVRCNVKVGPRPGGGYEGELDIVAYHHSSPPNFSAAHLLHIEPSLDALSWEAREKRFERKFGIGRKYIFKDVFPWLHPGTPLEQIAILITPGREDIAGGKIISIDQFIAEVKAKIQEVGIMAKHAIPEQYDVLRTIQMLTCGYYRIVASNVDSKATQL